MAGYVVLRTHGGLGNQLFQVLFGCLFADREGRTLLEVHDRRYRHAFVRSSALERGRSPSRWQLIMSAVRVPKLLQRVFGWREVPWRLGRTVYLDGYFQRANSYSVDADRILTSGGCGQHESPKSPGGGAQNDNKPTGNIPP